MTKIFDEILASISWMHRHGVKPSSILVDDQTRVELMRTRLAYERAQFKDSPFSIDARMERSGPIETVFGIPVKTVLLPGRGWMVVRDGGAWERRPG